MRKKDGKGGSPARCPVCLIRQLEKSGIWASACKKYGVEARPETASSLTRRVFSFAAKEARFCPNRTASPPRRTETGTGPVRHLFTCKGSTMRFHHFDDVQDHLDGLGLFNMDFGLDRMRKALAALGLDHPPFVTAQIVGTNGKGSTSTFLACLARAHGVKTGLYTSPHFVTPRARIRIDGRMLPESAWPALAERVMQAAPALTYFEFLTVLGLLAFAEAGVDFVVLEAGLGGHYDATSAAPVQAVCFTPIGMDHEKILGPTLTDIATDKAQAMRPGVPAFAAPQEEEALACLRRTAQEKGAELHETADLPFPETPLGLAGPHQRVNARLALAAWTWLASRHGWAQRPEAVASGRAAAHFPWRFQRLPAQGLRPPLILDGAHNPHGLRALEQALLDARITPSAVIFSCLADKDVTHMLPFVRRIAGDAPLFVPTIQDNERAMSGEDLARLLAEGRGAARTEAVQRVSLALREAARCVPPEGAEQHSVLLCGSLYLLGEFFILHPDALERELV